MAGSSNTHSAGIDELQDGSRRAYTKGLKPGGCTVCLISTKGCSSPHSETQMRCRNKREEVSAPLRQEAVLGQEWHSSELQSPSELKVKCRKEEPSLISE